MIADTRRGTDADHRHPAGVPGARRLPSDRLPPPSPAGRAEAARPRPAPERALTLPERARVLEVLHSERFVDASPLDEA